MRRTAIFAITTATLAAISVAIPVGAQHAEKHPLAATLLIKHNQARAQVGVPNLKWSPRLAAEARVWARQMARDDRMYHSTRDQRRNAGENLWRGTSGYYRPEDMIDAFLSERAMFRAGTFPEVSTTGNWADVAHYTQIIWAGTDEVGCAIVTGKRDDFLACRYWPSGNWIGQPVG
ncbi:CAP domain-containing protein [Altererythrobacter sp. ZODW24]|uniref:CAP domain-containing protein n=1 Tax=Altererythrobacter sp. ZODW24 TaxID=2185142 RepID=UPI000DF7F994|nr:CAP domain-containing protein [Altererythrobacter sp. ZODW24]